MEKFEDNWILSQGFLSVFAVVFLFQSQRYVLAFKSLFGK